MRKVSVWKVLEYLILISVFIGSMTYIRVHQDRLDNLTKMGTFKSEQPNVRDVKHHSQYQDENNSSLAYQLAREYAYNEYMSRHEIYLQLKRDRGHRFNHADINYALSKLKVDWNKNALATAQNYSDMDNLSQRAIYVRLITASEDGFTVDQANYALAHVHANWNYNALQVAEAYRSEKHYSKHLIRVNLIRSDGFTWDQVNYALANLK